MLLHYSDVARVAVEGLQSNCLSQTLLDCIIFQLRSVRRREFKKVSGARNCNYSSTCAANFRISTDSGKFSTEGACDYGARSVWI